MRNNCLGLINCNRTFLIMWNNCRLCILRLVRDLRRKNAMEHFYSRGSPWHGNLYHAERIGKPVVVIVRELGDKLRYQNRCRYLTVLTILYGDHFYSSEVDTSGTTKQLWLVQELIIEVFFFSLWYKLPQMEFRRHLISVNIFQSWLLGFSVIPCIEMSY
jgi:hypothetical protein